MIGLNDAFDCTPVEPGAAGDSGRAEVSDGGNGERPALAATAVIGAVVGGVDYLAAEAFGSLLPSLPVRSWSVGVDSIGRRRRRPTACRVAGVPSCARLLCPGRRQ
jgi:hypothetical protein